MILGAGSLIRRVYKGRGLVALLRVRRVLNVGTGRPQCARFSVTVTVNPSKEWGNALDVINERTARTGRAGS